MLKINLGCGTNRIPGWSNHDAEVNITRRLPWADDSADCVFVEHVVEHVTYPQALEFFREARRVLRTGGVLRVAVPSVERVWREATMAYCDFTRKWVQPEGDGEFDRLRGAMTNILFMHGHLAPWTQGLLQASLFYAGFDETQAWRPGESGRVELRDLEGHGKVIGDQFNAIETVVVEAIK